MRIESELFRVHEQAPTAARADSGEILQFLQAWANSWRDWHFDIEEVLDADSQVFVAIREWGIGVESDASVDQRRYFAVTVEHGRIMRVRMFSDRTEALKAVGLEE